MTFRYGISTSAMIAAMMVAAPGLAQAQQEDPGEQVIVTGTRTSGFKASDSPAPVQVLGSDALKTVGQTSLIQGLAQQIPSIQAQAFGSDQAQFHPSIKLRGLNPNHTLILLDGKRRHGTASVIVTGGPFGGAAAADISLIPQDSIERVEVLLDGAAAQYGTDAIAGVLNIIQKKRDHGGTITLTGGKYFDQGGKQYTAMGNIGMAPFENAYLNITAEHRFSDYSFRGDLDPRLVDTGVAGSANTGANGGRTILANYPEVRNFPNYPYVNRIAGDGRLRLTNVTYTAGWQIAPEIELYGNGTFSRKIGVSFQNYRLPTVIFGQRPNAAAIARGVTVARSAADSADIPFRAGFNPRQQVKETDYAQTLGLKGEIAETTWDVSSTYGRNDSETYVIDSANGALYYDSSSASVTAPRNGVTPRETYNGTFIASQWTNTLDLTHQFDVGFSEPLTLAGGLEYRRETYALKAGEEASYYISRIANSPAQGGIQSFFGYAPANTSRNIRHNFSQYLDVSAKPTAEWLIDAAIRHEDYSDFGQTTIFKVTSRYDFTPDFGLRGTVSTGFRAPTLAEGFYSGINVGPASLSGIFAPNSVGAQALGISNLDAEKSTNFSGGFVFHPMPRMTLTVDAYQIGIRDRIVQSSTFLGASSVAGSLLSPNVVTALRANGVPVDAVLATIATGANGSVSVNTFVNGVKTRTRGIDAVLDYSTNFGEWGRVNWSLVGNYNKTTIRSVNAPPSGINQAVQLLDVYAQSQLTNSTPKYRATAGALWTFGDLTVNLRESYYGSSFVIISTPTNGQARERLGISPKFITDLEVGYQIADPVKISIGANNLFNKYPNKYPQFIRDQQYAASSTAYITQYPTFSPIGINGGYYYARVGVNF